MSLKKSAFIFSLIAISCTYSAEVSDDDNDENTTHYEEVVTAPSRFEVRDGYNFFTIAEFLYWIAQEDGLYFAQSGVTSTAPIAFDGYLKKIRPHWNPGVRLTFGGNMPYDGWDVLTSWTYFHSNAIKTSNGEGLYLWSTPSDIDTNIGSNFKAGWNLNTNLIDAEMGRNSWLGTYFSIRPFFGVRGAWLKQNFTTQALIDSTTVKSRARSNFTGAGGRAGLDLRLHFKQGWSLIAEGSAALLYGVFNTGFTQKANDTEYGKAADKYRNGVSTARILLGTQWDTFFSKGSYHFGGRVAWEQNLWFGINKMAHWTTNLANANVQQGNHNLSLQGVTISARLDF